MSKRLAKIFSLATALMVAVSLAAPAAAAPAEGATLGLTTDGVVAQVLADNPDSVRVNKHEIVFPNGTRMLVYLDAPAPGAIGTLGQYDCPYYFLCLFLNANFSGNYVGWDAGPANSCDDVNLVADINNVASSLVNNRPSGTVSTFWDNSNQTGLLGYQHAYGYRQNLAVDAAAIGGNWDNRISSMRVC